MAVVPRVCQFYPPGIKSKSGQRKIQRNRRRQQDQIEESWKTKKIMIALGTGKEDKRERKKEETGTRIDQTTATQQKHSSLLCKSQLKK